MATKKMQKINLYNYSKGNITNFLYSIRYKEWLRVLCLASAGFIFNTTEFIPVGLLSDIAKSFMIKPAEAGLIITVYAWGVALLSLPLMLLTNKIERRSLMMVVFTLFIASHAITVISWNFWILMFSRVGVSVAHAIFWSITTSLIIRVGPKDKSSYTLSLLTTGTAMATLLGLPLGRLIGQHLGWRISFGAIGFSASIIMLLLWCLLPLLPSNNAGNLRSLPKLIKQPALLSIYIITMIIISAHYTAYSYIEPFMQHVAFAKENFTTMLLLLFGAAGVCGSLLFSLLGSRYPKELLFSVMSCVIICLLLLLPIAPYNFGISLLCLLWGTAMTTIVLILQVKVLNIAYQETDVAVSIFSGIFNLGIGAGALLGSKVSLFSSMNYIGITGAVIAFLALALSICSFYRYNKELSKIYF